MTDLHSKKEKRCPWCYEKLYWKDGVLYCKGINKETGTKCGYTDAPRTNPITVAI